MFGVSPMKIKNDLKIKSISYFKLIIGIIVLISILFSAFVKFYYKETKISYENSQVILKEHTENSSKLTEMEFSNALEFIVYQAKVFGEFDDIHSQEALSLLDKTTNSELFNTMQLADVDGKSLDYNNIEINISDRDYFKAAITNGASVISNGTDFKSDNNELIVVSAPIYKNEHIVGVLYGSYNTERLYEIINNSHFYGNSSISIVTGNGDKISISQSVLSSENVNGANFFEEMKMADFKGESTYKNFIDSVENKQPLFCKYSVDGETYVTYITNIGINDWLLVNTVSAKSFFASSNSTIKNVLWLLAEDAFIISIFLIIIYLLINRNTKAAQNTTKRISMLINNLSCGVVEFRANENFSIEYISDSMFTMFGYNSDDAKQYKDKLKDYLLTIIDNQNYEKLINSVDSTVNSNQQVHFECCAKSKNKEPIWISVDGGLIETDLKSGPVLQFTFMDITDLKSTVFRIDKDRTRYLKLLSINNDFCFEYYFEKDLIYFSDNALKILNCPSEIKNFSQFIKDKDEITTRNVEQCGIFNKDNFTNEKASSSKLQLLCNDGTYHWFKIDLTPINDAYGKMNSIIGRATDITNEKAETDSIIEASRKDLMTGLLNKVTVESEIRYYLNNSDSGDKNAFIIIDVDDFKTINDTFGHASGDEMIKQVSDLLKDSFRNSDILGRVGGDEFVIFMRKISDRDMLEEKIQVFLHDILLISLEKDCKVSCSAGIVFISGSKNVDYKQLFELADKNLYNSKLNGKNCYTISNWGES